MDSLGLGDPDFEGPLKKNPIESRFPGYSTGIIPVGFGSVKPVQTIISYIAVMLCSMLGHLIQSTYYAEKLGCTVPAPGYISMASAPGQDSQEGRFLARCKGKRAWSIPSLLLEIPRIPDPESPHERGCITTLLYRGLSRAKRLVDENASRS